MRFLNRAQESFTTTGTGTLTLGGAPTGWRTFAAALNADFGLSGTVAGVAYFAVSADEATWEFGYGTVDTAAGTITRTPIASSTGAAINWPAGTKYIFSTPEAVNFTTQLAHFRGASAPPVPRAGYIWADSLGGAEAVLLKYYDGADWVTLGLLNETANTFTPYYNGAALTSAFAQLGVANTFSQPQTISYASAGNTITPLRAHHAEGTNLESHVRIQIDAGATSGGDPWLEWNVLGGGLSWSMGIDNSDSDALKIQKAQGLDGTDIVRILNGVIVGSGMTDQGAGTVNAQNNFYQANQKLLPVLQRIVIVDATFTAISATTPAFDDTIPQNTEGTQIFSQAITPKIASSTIRARSLVYVSQSTGSNVVVASLFVDSGANAVSSGVTGNIGTGSMNNALVEHDYAPGDTSAHTIAVRVGGNSASAVNGIVTGSARRFGGALRSFLELTEIAA